MVFNLQSGSYHSHASCCLLQRIVHCLVRVYKILKASLEVGMRLAYQFADMQSLDRVHSQARMSAGSAARASSDAQKWHECPEQRSSKDSDKQQQPQHGSAADASSSLSLDKASKPDGAQRAGGPLQASAQGLNIRNMIVD